MATTSVLLVGTYASLVIFGSSGRENPWEVHLLEHDRAFCALSHALNFLAGTYGDFMSVRSKQSSGLPKRMHLVGRKAMQM